MHNIIRAKDVVKVTYTYSLARTLTYLPLTRSHSLTFFYIHIRAKRQTP